ncbi:MAG: transcriptional repressor [Verrucomicrobia bacterium]|nr:transcriptional repressor [Verrucomicrobiota bacterium]
MASSGRQNQHPRACLTLETILAQLRAAGMRITRSRQQILISLLAAERPLSLHEIQQRAAAGAVTPDFATVFRVMNALEKMRLAQKVNLNRPGRYYELLNPQQHHDHLVCTECGRVTLMIEACPVEKFQRAIERRYGYADVKHSLEFFGKCPACK